MEKDKNKRDVFISYSSKNAEQVFPVVERLEAAGVKCWVAPRDVVGNYSRAIVNGIEGAKLFLLFLSSDSAVSDQVLNEMEMAYKIRKRNPVNPIIIEPLCLEKLDIDDPLYDDIMYYIQRINFLNPNVDMSADQIATEILEKHGELFDIPKSKPKERAKSLYFTSERETARLQVQNKLLKAFDGEVYSRIFDKYYEPLILDVGCGNGSMIMDRLSECDGFRLIGIERDEGKVLEAEQNHSGKGAAFYQADVEDGTFSDRLFEIMDAEGIEGFDVINVSMLLLHLKSQLKLIRILRRVLAPGGTLIIKDIDDGLNFAYPDDNGAFERVYRICDNNETSGERQNGRQIYTNLYRAGFRSITLEKQGYSTVGMTCDEKEDFFNMYFKFILGDVKWMHEKYPDNAAITKDCAWYEEYYDDLFDDFMREDFVFSLGFIMYTATK